ncbi:hypothetical protein FY034_13140 [Trichlorobacter lovleyi]|uniref:hypothetical protein n=1 Tax=Trichlorobacter lovleyi TaxID=313985 RepID=UPI00223EDBAE|nr:hypothetical protein [Trichlorobacter lovleyi]QOX79836.1 hypothetical protein FY034_13140 [Trichlorobacter lovleyi]
MRYFMFFMLSLLALNASSYASDCKIIEKDGSTEVVCVGNDDDKIILDKEEKRVDQLNKERLIEIKKELEVLKSKADEATRQMQEEAKTRINTVRVASLDVIDISRSPYYVTYSIKAQIENIGPKGNISVDIIASNNSGYELEKVVLRGFFAADSSRILTHTVMVKTGLANRIGGWKAVSYSKY